MPPPDHTSAAWFDDLADTESANEMPPHLPLAVCSMGALHSIGATGQASRPVICWHWMSPTSLTRRMRAAYLNWRVTQLKRNIEFMQSDLHLLADLIQQQQQLSRQLRDESQRLAGFQCAY